MRKLWYWSVIAILFCLVTAVSTPASDTASIPRISKEKVKTMLGKRNVIVVDVRVGPDWNNGGSKIKGAIREDPRTVENWFRTLPKKKTLVFYCA